MPKPTEIDFSMLLAASVHDMKNSVGFLMASLEEAMEDTPQAAQKDHQRLSRLHNETSRVSSELVQLLALYQLQDRKTNIRRDTCYLRDLLDEQIARNDIAIRAAHIEVLLVCDEMLEAFVDGELLATVVHNALLNAIQHAKTKIELRADMTTQGISVIVEDDGPGYPQDLLGIWNSEEPFDRIQKNSLGLYFAYSIARAHQSGECTGDISLVNCPEGGARFTVVLPQ